MIEEEQQIERIEAWFAGTMSPDEKARFEEDLASDHELRQFFEKHTYLLDGFEGMKMQAFADKMRQTKNPSSRSGNRRSLWATISIAATVIALIGITYFVVQPSGTQRIAMEYYTAPLAEVSRSDTPAEDSFFQEGMSAYASKNWEKAIAAFSKVNADHPDYVRALYFQAHSTVAEKRYSKALDLFDGAVFRNSELQQQAEWNRVLMMMFLQYRPEEIAERLKRIEINPDHFYKNKATALLKELELD